MEDLKKISSNLLFTMWKNLSVGILIIITLISCTRLLPFFLAPVLALGGAMVIYTLLFNSKVHKEDTCNLILYAFFYCVILYCIVSITLNVLYSWGIIVLPDELVFFNEPYLVSLVLMPCCFLTMIVIYIRRKRLWICVECQLTKGNHIERGLPGKVLSHETNVQMLNLLVIFGLLSVIEWGYYLTSYVSVNQNARDIYVFVWLALIICLVDEIFFIFRYVNLYLDLKEANEIITPGELSDMTSKTYLRLYLICGNKIFLDPHSIDRSDAVKEGIDTPFQTKRAVNGISAKEVNDIADRMTGISGGKLRFFFGRRSEDLNRHSMLRYFYFLDGKPEDYIMRSAGEWYDFNEIKNLYSHDSPLLCSMFASDLSRLARIMVTHKLYDEQGRRKYKIKSYRPTFNLEDVRQSDLDFQDDKWIRVSLFNADTPLYKLKRLFRKNTDSKNHETR